MKLKVTHKLNSKESAEFNVKIKIVYYTKTVANKMFIILKTVA